MNEEVTKKTVTTKILHLNQDDLEQLIKDWLGDEISTEWKFDFDFDAHAECEVLIKRIITTVDKVDS